MEALPQLRRVGDQHHHPFRQRVERTSPCHNRYVASQCWPIQVPNTDIDKGRWTSRRKNDSAEMTSVTNQSGQILGVQTTQ